MSAAFDAIWANLLAYSSQIARCERSSHVLDRLDEALNDSQKLRVLSAARFPLKSGDWEQIELGETVFLHKSVPNGWWREYLGLARLSYDPIVMLARVSLAPFTWSESRAMLNLVGADRAVLELCNKYGMRDGFTCPVGGRWMLSFWSAQSLAHITNATRAALFMAASFAAMRLEQLLKHNAVGGNKGTGLTQREVAVLRWASVGRRIPETARALGLSEETLRTHIKNAREKLRTHSVAHAVAEAMRLRLFP